MDSCPSHLALFYQTQHQAWPLLLSVKFEHYLSWVELTRIRLSCPFLFGSFTSATSIESLARLIYSLQHDWYDVFVLARSWKQAAENSQQSFGTSTQAALRAIYIIVDSLISWLGHKKLKLHDFRRIIHKVLDIPTYHRLQRNTCLKSPIHWPYKKRWSKCELRYLEDLLLLTQHLHFVWVLFPEIHHFLTCFRSALRVNIDRLPKYCVLPYYQVISQTWCSLTPYLSPGDVTRLSMTRHVLLHLHRQMEVTYAIFTLKVSSFPPKKKWESRVFVCVTSILEFWVGLSLPVAHKLPCFAAISVLIRRFRLPSVNISPASSPLSCSWPPMIAHGDPPLDGGFHLLKDHGRLRSMPSLLTTPRMDVV